MKTYFIHNGQTQEGPFTIEDLKSRNLSGEVPIWFEGLASWTTVHNIPELKLSQHIPPPLQVNSFPYNTSLESHLNLLNADAKKRKMSMIIPLTIVGVVLCIALFGWFVFTNNLQAQEVNAIKQTQAELTTQQKQQAQEKDEADAKRVKINEEITKKNMEYRNRWTEYINFRDYVPPSSTGFGGYEAFQIPVYNTTDYTLEEVQVSVDYIKSNGSIYKTEVVTVYNILAHSQKTITAPASSRGTSIRYEITGINSKKMHFCFPLNNGNPEDPYFCR